MACNGCLWVVDNNGTIKYLKVKEGCCWKELEYDRIEFKRVAVSSQMAFAIGSDHQIYLYVQTRDVPIRVAETCFENQRAYPIKGFCSTLLPTDRPKFSSEDGTTELPKENFKLPSTNWTWERDWCLVDNLDGEVLEPECWTYALDFPMEYQAAKRWNHIVRRRKWTRHRRYIAFNRWVLLESVHEDHVIEPFIDVASGGEAIPGNTSKKLCVWAVTVLSRVFVRLGVESNCPEGTSWLLIDQEEKVNQLSVGPTGLVWAVTWAGNALVRTGVNRDHPYGTAWVEVEAPESYHLMQVAVGVDCVWAITRDFRVWFRKGIRGASSNFNDSCATGSGWIEMVGEMSAISVSPYDQVYAVGCDRRTIYFRTGISSGELHGKTWKAIYSDDDGDTDSNVVLPDSNEGEESDSVSRSGSMASSTLDTYESKQMAIWTWISASAVTVNGDMYINSASSSNTEINYAAVGSWRDSLKVMLQERRAKEMKGFVGEYAMAIEKGTWIKCCRAFKYSSSGNHVVCQLELERQGVETGTESGKLICSYSPNKKPVETIVVSLAEIACIHIETDSSIKNYSNVLTIHVNTSEGFMKRLLSLVFNNNKDLEDWFTTLNIACNNIQETDALQAQPSFWAVTEIGAVYIGFITKSGYFFRHCGDGYFSRIESCSDGVTWAITHDEVLYVYSDGFGGGMYKGISGASSAVYPVEGMKTYYIYENQRWNPLTGYTAVGLPTDRPMWSNKNGTKGLSKDDIQTPSKLWQWITEWTIDYNLSNGVDENGWQYAVDFPFQYHRNRSFTDTARRRRWYRRCKVSTTGPWLIQESPPLLSVSLCSYNDLSTGERYICAWAIAKNGDALCRVGVSKSSPAGTSWVHVPCNQKLVDIAVGGDHNQLRIWATAVDGTACLRNGISRTKLEGISWFYVEPPRHKGQFCPLHKISVGCQSVFAIDKTRTLWIREKVVHTFPEGVEWRKVADNVVKISTNSSDQYCVLSTLKGKKENKTKILSIRDQVTEENRIGSHWKLTGINAFDDVSFI